MPVSRPNRRGMPEIMCFRILMLMWTVGLLLIDEVPKEPNLRSQVEVAIVCRLVAILLPQGSYNRRRPYGSGFWSCTGAYTHM